MRFMKVFNLILYPFGVIMDLVTSVRNRLYDQGLRPVATFDLPVISVGNLSVGGTGKTPMIEHLIRLLKPTTRLATLSRGYKRKTKGFRIAGASDSAETIGDEPFQFYSKFRDEITVTVGEERAMAIPQIIDEYPEVNVILLDDAFQHRRVKPSFQILLSDYKRPFYSDYLLPAGRLRESKSGSQRADVIVVTKCPDSLSEEEMMSMETRVRQYADKPVFFTSIHYGNVVAVNSGTAIDRNVILVTGIANSDTVEHYVENNFKLVRHFRFADHHDYTVREIEEICALAKSAGASIITTEKDAAKISSEQFRVWVAEAPFFYLPIEIQFLKNGQDFDAMILNVVNMVKDA